MNDSLYETDSNEIMKKKKRLMSPVDLGTRYITDSLCALTCLYFFLCYGQHLKPTTCSRHTVCYICGHIVPTSYILHKHYCSFYFRYEL